MSENGQRVIAEVRAEAARRPNHVHDGECSYVWRTKDTPGCLVGVGLWNAGLINSKWTQKYPTLNISGITSLGRSMFGFDYDEIQWLRRVQIDQDAHHTWARAVEWADEMAAKDVKVDA
jgi:hypothetical protein